MSEKSLLKSSEPLSKYVQHLSDNVQGRVQGGGGARNPPPPLDIQEKETLQLKNTASTVGRLVTAWERRRIELAYQ